MMVMDDKKIEQSAVVWTLVENINEHFLLNTRLTGVHCLTALFEVTNTIHI